MERCKCGREIHISPALRSRIREFKREYPWVTQLSLATLFGISQARVSEIIRMDHTRGGW